MFAGATLLLAAATSAAPAATASRDVQSALLEAIHKCGMVTLSGGMVIDARVGEELFTGGSGSAAQSAASRGQLTEADVPDLVKRFASRTTTARLGVVDFVRLAASDGDVWLIKPQQRQMSCDIMATNVRALSATQIGVTQRLQSEQGWKLWRQTDGSDVSPMWTAILTKSLHVKGEPDRGLRVRFEGLTEKFAKPDGIQMQANVVAGDLKITDTELTVGQHGPSF